MFYVIDEIPGAGKTCAAINFINNSPNEKFLYVTPFKTEVNRICLRCGFVQPKDEYLIQKADGETETKRIHKRVTIKYLIKQGKNIATTHTLFSLLDDETIEMLKSMKYILMLDESLEVVEPWGKVDYDIDVLLDKYCYTTERGLIKWKKEMSDYPDVGGVYSDIKKELSDKYIAVNQNKIAVKMFPIEYFNAFKDTYIMTYLFNGNPQRMYFDYHNIKYNNLYVSGNSVETYHFTNKEQIHKPTDFRKLITIVDGKINDVGSDLSLSYTWYENQLKEGVGGENLNRIQKSAENFFQNKMPPLGYTSKDYLWTVYKDAKPRVVGKRYTNKQFLSYTARATNDYADKKVLAYLINKYMNVNVKEFFKSFDIYIDEDTYSTGEMIQWIWRSAIRRGEHIYIYVPSYRMRTLLVNWIEEQSGKKIENREKLLTRPISKRRM